MKTEIILNNLRNISTNDLSRVMNISPNMARKYKREPWKYDPPTTKAVDVELSFSIPVRFWKDIKSFISNESVQDNNNKKEVRSA